MSLYTYKRLLDKTFRLERKSDFIQGLIAGRPHFYTFSARGGIEAIIELLGLNKEGAITLLPAFSAQGIVLPFQRRKANYVFYKSDKFLRPDIQDIKAKVKELNIKALIVVHYFGFTQDLDEMVSFARQNNFYLLEDCAQAFLSKYSDGKFVGCKGHISFFSLTKFLPVPDGSLFIINDSRIDTARIVYQKSFLLKPVALICSILSIYFKSFQVKYFKRNNFILEIFSKAFNLVYYKIICTMQNPQRMSGYTMKRLMKFNLEKFMESRIRNAKIYTDNLNLMQDNLWIDYSSQFILSGYPIQIRDRNLVKNCLKRRNIETLSYTRNWFYVPDEQLSEFETEKSFLDHHLLMPVNENYSAEDIEYIVRQVNDILSPGFKN